MPSRKESLLKGFHCILRWAFRRCSTELGCGVKGGLFLFFDNLVGQTLWGLTGLPKVCSAGRKAKTEFGMSLAPC